MPLPEEGSRSVYERQPEVESLVGKSELGRKGTSDTLVRNFSSCRTISD
jgi:hypothetical protein